MRWGKLSGTAPWSATKPQALLFGTHFHTAVLEFDQYQRTTQRVPWQQIEDSAAAVRRQRFCRDLLHGGQAEQTHIATHEATRLVLKVRPNLMITSPKIGRVVIVDFKTTSAQDYAHFVATIEQYDYDRQATLYSDLLGAARFIIIGVQKKNAHKAFSCPFEVWQFEATPAPGLLEQGRKKYQRPMKAFVQQQARRSLPVTLGRLEKPWASASSRM